MKLLKLQRLLEIKAEEIRNAGGDIEASEVALEAVDDTGEIYYENSFGLFLDDRNDIGLSPINK